MARVTSLWEPSIKYWIDGYNPLAAIIAESKGFDGIWVSSLAVSTSMGVRDANELSWKQVLDLVDYIVDAVSIPVILDADTGYGDCNIVGLVAKKAWKCGVSGFCIEDKVFPKLNSLLDQPDPLASVEEFCSRIEAAKQAVPHPGFNLIARCEALVAGHGVQEALERSHAYCEAGADAIFISSKTSDYAEVSSFAAKWVEKAPLVICPTTYPDTPTSVFEAMNVSAVIWANHNIRASMKAMIEVSQSIKLYGTPVHIKKKIASVQEIFSLIGYKSRVISF